MRSHPAWFSTRMRRAYVETFNANDKEDIVNRVPNRDALEWITANAPLWDCPSTRFEET